MKNQNIVAMNTFSYFQKLIGILGYYTTGQLKNNLADNVKEKNFEVTAVEITVNLDFRVEYE